MTTTTVPITIVCPDWCVVPAEVHAADLWNLGGCCDHRSADRSIKDPTGYQEPLGEPKPWEDVRVQLAHLTTPDGRPQAPAILFIGDREHSIEQYEAIKTCADDLVAQFRQSGPA